MFSFVNVWKARRQKEADGNVPLRSRAVWLAPAVVFALLCGCYISAGLFPFGSSTLAWCDMQHQVVPLMMDFKDILAGKASMFLNLQNAGGMSFWGVFFFFLASPFTFLAALVPKTEFYLLMNVLVLLKITLSACTAAVLFTRVFPRLPELPATCFSAMYALSGFALMYYQNVVWLDMACLFPALVLGLVYLYREEKPALFVLALCGTLLIHYYLSAMVLFWLVLLFAALASFGAEPERRGRRLLLLGLCTTAALLATAVVWLPSFYQYLGSGRGVDLLSSLSSGSFLTALPTSLPIVYCTGSALAALPLYLVSRRKSGRTRALMVSYVLLLLPVLIDPIDRMWHLGSYQAFPVRFGYIITLTGLLLDAACLCENRRLDQQPDAPSHPLYLLAAGVAVAAMLGHTIRLLTLPPSQYHEMTYYVQNLWASAGSLYWGLSFSLLAGGVFLALFCFVCMRRLSVQAFCILLCIATVTEITFNTSVYITPAATNGHAYRQVLDLAERIPDKSLYNVKTDDSYYDTNLTGALGYPVLDHYTSLTDGTYMDTLQKMGYAAHWMEIRSRGGTVLTDALLAQKYSVTRLGTEKTRTTVYSNPGYALVRQPYWLSYGFVSQQLGQSLADGDRFAAQDTLYRSLCGGSGSLMTRYTPTASTAVQVVQQPGGGVHITSTPGGSLRYHILVSNRTTLYFDCYNHASRDLSDPLDNAFRVSVNGCSVRDSYPNSDYNALLELGTFKDESVDIEVEVLHPAYCRSFGVAGMNVSKLQAAFNSMEKANLHPEKNGLSGTVTAKNGGWLVLPMRGGSGFCATVNGRSVQTSLALGTFLAVPLQAGKNQVSVSYMPPGFASGFGMSLLGIAMVILLLLIFRKYHGWPGHVLWLETLAQVLFTVLAAVLLAALYVFPVVVYLSCNYSKL